jgi:hypothetical protein
MSDNGSNHIRVHRGWRWLSVVFGLLGGAAFVGRFVFVSDNVLYGTTAFAMADEIAASLLALAAAFFVLSRKRPHTEKPEERHAGQRWTDGAAAIAAFASVITLLISTSNLLQPATPASLTAPACPGTPVRNVDYVGLTAGDEGTNSRQGPSQSYIPTGRFPKGCSIGFASFCLGQPITDPTGSTDSVTWVTERWLEVAHQPPGPWAWLAQELSGESPDRRFISDAYITPETRYDLLRPLPSDQCPSTERFPAPRGAKLAAFDATTSQFSASADYAVNMGFAIWVPDQAPGAPGHYRQIFTPGGKPTDNPGKTSGGRKSVHWDPSLTGALPTGAGSSRIVVLAVPCLADNIAADGKLAAVQTYNVDSSGQTTVDTSLAPGFDHDQLVRTACSAAT